MASPKIAVQERNPFSPKLLGMAAAGILLACVFSFLGASLSLGTVPAVLIVLIVFLAVLPLQVFLFSSRRMAALVILVEGLMMILPFLFPFSILVLCAGLVFVLLLLKATRYAAKTMDNQLTIRFFETSRRFLPTVFTGIALFVTLTFVNSFHFSMQELSKETWTHLTKPYEMMLRPLGFSLESATPRQAVEWLLVMQGGDQVKNLSAAQKKAAVDALEGQLRTTMKPYGVTWTKNEKLIDIAYRLVSANWAKAPTALKVLIPVLIGLVTYVMMKYLGIVLWRLSWVLALLLYKMGFWTGFARITVEKRDKQVIVCA